MLQNAMEVTELVSAFRRHLEELLVELIAIAKATDGRKPATPIDLSPVAL